MACIRVDENQGHLGDTVTNVFILGPSTHAKTFACMLLATQQLKATTRLNLDEQGMLEARVAELNENNRSLEARLATAEAEVKRLKLAGHGAGGLDAGDAERLASLLESQTQALEGQCMRLQHETTYIRKVSFDVQ